MSELPKHIQLLDACRTALKPLFRIMLRSGISYKDFNEVSKSLFVEIATNEYGLRGRDTNISRVAIMTGLTRKEVKKIRDAGWENIREEKASTKLSPASAVLHFWHTDQSFLDREGMPKHIPYEGANSSFLSLAKKYGGDVPPGALFKELIRSEAIDTDTENRFFPVKRHFVPTDIDKRLLTMITQGLAHHISSVDHNSRPDVFAGGGAWMERIVWAVIPKSKSKKVKARLHKDAQEFTEEIDSKFSDVEIVSSQHTRDRKVSKEVGIGVFYFEQ